MTPLFSFASPTPWTRSYHTSRPILRHYSCRLSPFRSVRMTATGAAASEASNITDGLIETVAESTLKPSEVQCTPFHWRVPVVGVMLDAALGRGGPELARKHGPFYRTTHFPGDVFIVADHSAACAVQRNPTLFTSSSSQASIESLIGKRSIVTLDGSEHRRLRRVYAPLFAPRAMARFFDATARSARLAWTELSPHRAGDSATAVDIEPSVKAHFLRVALSIIMKDFRMARVASADRLGTACLPGDRGSEVLTDIPLSCITDALDAVLLSRFRPKIPPFVQMADDAINRLAEITAPILRNRLERDADTIRVLRSGSDRLIAARTAILAERMDFITVLAALSGLPVGTDLTAAGDSFDTEIVEQSRGIVLFFVAGVVTTAPTFLSCVKRVLQDDRLHTALLKEQAAIDELTLDAVTDRMPLLSSTLQETMRYYPAALVTTRHATQDVYIAGHLVRAGEAVLTDVWAANRDPAVFHRPDTFDPFRFMPPDRGGGPAPAGAILTMGAPGSPHFCLGASLAKMEIKTTIAILLREFDVELLTSSRKDDFQPVPNFKPRSVKLSKCCPREQQPSS